LANTDEGRMAIYNEYASETRLQEAMLHANPVPF
jgi:hypothetical protein